MKLHYGILLLVLHSIAVAAGAEEYVVQVETLGYLNAPAAAAAPAEVPLRSVELVCRPDVLSRSDVKTGNERLTLNATLHRKSNNVFSLDIDYFYSIDTGDSYIDLSGACVKRADGTRAQTEMSVQMGSPAVLGGLITTRRNADDVERVSITRIVVHLRNYEPPKELPKQSDATPRREEAVALTVKSSRVRLSRDVHRRLLELR